MRDDRRGRDAETLAGATEEAQCEAEARTQQGTDQPAVDQGQTQADFDPTESDPDRLAQHARDRDQVWLTGSRPRPRRPRFSD
jgi:hypothetical protein